MSPEYIMGKEGEIIPMPEPSPESEEPEEVAYQPVPEPEPKAEEKGELDDLFEVPQPEDNDMVTDHLVELDEEDDLSDLTSVSREDIMGEPYPGVPSVEEEVPIQRLRRVKRTGRRYYPTPPPSLGGLRP